MGLPEDQQALEGLCYPEHMCRSGEEPDIWLHLSAKKKQPYADKSTLYIV